MEHHATSDAILGGRCGTEGPVRTDKEKERPSPRTSPTCVWQPFSDATAMTMTTFGGPDVGSEFYRSVSVVVIFQLTMFRLRPSHNTNRNPSCNPNPIQPPKYPVSAAGTTAVRTSPVAFPNTRDVSTLPYRRDLHII